MPTAPLPALPSPAGSPSAPVGNLPSAGGAPAAPAGNLPAPGGSPAAPGGALPPAPGSNGVFLSGLSWDGQVWPSGFYPRVADVYGKAAFRTQGDGTLYEISWDQDGKWKIWAGTSLLASVTSAASLPPETGWTNNPAASDLEGDAAVSAYPPPPLPVIPEAPGAPEAPDPMLPEGPPPEFWDPENPVYPTDAVRHSPQTLTDVQRDQVVSNIGLPDRWKIPYLDGLEDYAVPAENLARLKLGMLGNDTPLSVNSTGLWISHPSGLLPGIVALRGTDGWAVTEGSDSGVAFRWISDWGGMDRAGFFFEYESFHRATFSNQNLTASRKFQMPDRDGTLALLEGPQTFTGNTLMPNQTADSAASAMNRALVERAGLFSMLTAPPSDLAIFTLNSGAGAGSGGDGDTLSSGTAANARPNGYRWRNLDRNPGGSGSLTLAVRSMLFSCMGTAYHPGSSNADGKMRCGIGIATGSGAPAGEAQPLAGRGWGWEIFWDAGTAKIRFRLFAHNGSVFVTNDGLSGRAGSIDTGILPSNADAMFFVCMGLNAAGLVSAWAAFGTLEQIRAVNRITPILTLAGGPTSGTVASTGFPSWHSANHSTVAPAVGMQFRISARSLVFTNP